MSEREAFLVIENGEPYADGSTIKLLKEGSLLGRSWGEHKPEVEFANRCISRKHAVINSGNNCFTITDLGSKHGTEVNNRDIGQNQPYKLKHGDQINLAKGVAIITFYNPSEVEAGETVELISATVELANESFTNTYSVKSGFIINLDRREVLVDGKPLNLYGKDLDLLLLLYQSVNKAVTYDEIKKQVWPERIPDSVSNVPEVGKDEISALVYRLRKRLGEYGKCIVSLPRYGYMLEM